MSAAAVAPTEREARGLLDLRFALGPAGRTELVRRRQRFPLRMTTPMYLDPAEPGTAFVYVQNPTGGTFAGDRLELCVEAAPGARVHLTTPSAAKIYRMEDGHAEQLVELRIGRAAHVEYVPEPLLPQAGSRYSQQLEVDLAKDATFIGWEIIAPGRVARGEAFGYDRLDLRSTFRLAGSELCAERLLLEPRRRSPAQRGIAGGVRHIGSLVALAPHADVERLTAAMDMAVAGCLGAIGGAGLLPNQAGVLVRTLGETSASVRTMLEQAWRAARLELCGLPLPPRRR
jgi:urease accessory protein